MTSISSAAQVYSPPATSHAHSGKGRLAQAIAQQEQNGALSSTDATALTSALGAIDSSLQGDTSSATGAAGQSGSGSNRLDPSQTKDRIDSLIADQVSSGGLTSDQASALKNLFSSHGTSVTSSTDTTGGAPPPPPGPPPSDNASTGADVSSVSGASSGTNSTNDLLSTFIQQLQAAQSSGSGYASSGATASTQSAALLFDFKS